MHCFSSVCSVFGYCLPTWRSHPSFLSPWAIQGGILDSIRAGWFKAEGGSVGLHRSQGSERSYKSGCKDRGSWIHSVWPQLSTSSPITRDGSIKVLPTLDNPSLNATTLPMCTFKDQLQQTKWLDQNAQRLITGAFHIQLHPLSNRKHKMWAYMMIRFTLMFCPLKLFWYGRLWSKANARQPICLH